MGEAQDVAYAALYLASDESKYVTTIELNVDGEFLLVAQQLQKKCNNYLQIVYIVYL